MDFDVEGNLKAVERSVSALERDGQPARAVILSRSYPTTVEDLWDAVTSGERIARWFLPVSGKLELGGRYQLEGNAGGLITACERASHLALTWEFGEDVSWVEVRFLGGWSRQSAAYPHPHRAALGALGRVRTGRGRRRLGAGSPGARAPSRAAGRGKAGRSRFCCLTGRQGVHHRQQRGVGASGGRSGNGPRRRPCGGKAHGRVLHR